MGAFDSGWDQLDNMKVKQSLRRVIQRAQRPSKLTAMRFKDISLHSFTSVKIGKLMKRFHSRNYSITDLRFSLFLLHSAE